MPAVLVAHPVPAVRKAEEPRRGRQIEWGGGSVGSGAVGMQLPRDCATGEGLLQMQQGMQMLLEPLQ
jgi:hypothetical protein